MRKTLIACTVLLAAGAVLIVQQMPGRYQAIAAPYRQELLRLDTVTGRLAFCPLTHEGRPIEAACEPEASALIVRREAQPVNQSAPKLLLEPDVPAPSPQSEELVMPPDEIPAASKAR